MLADGEGDDEKKVNASDRDCRGAIMHCHASRDHASHEVLTSLPVRQPHNLNLYHLRQSLAQCWACQCQSQKGRCESLVTFNLKFFRVKSVRLWMSS